jgi:prepilin-type N-terminal cleavage/methylation domain-containing protein
MPVFGNRIENQMKPSDQGFTLIEIVVVMVLVSIIATVAFTRSITTDKLNLVSRADKIQTHLRYAQSMAMKTNDVWGIFCNGSQYWLFNGYTGPEVMTGIELPGENSNVIDLADSGLAIYPFWVYFDNFGKPYNSYSGPGTNSPVLTGSPLIITIASTEDASLNRKFSITPETGLIVVTQ